MRVTQARMNAGFYKRPRMLPCGAPELTQNKPVLSLRAKNCKFLPPREEDAPDYHPDEEARVAAGVGKTFPI